MLSFGGGREGGRERERERERDDFASSSTSWSKPKSTWSTYVDFRPLFNC